MTIFLSIMCYMFIRNHYTYKARRKVHNKIFELLPNGLYKYDLAKVIDLSEKWDKFAPYDKIFWALLTRPSYFANKFIKENFKE